jgi:hypothetical protein
MSTPIQHLLSVPMCGLPCAFCGQPVRLIRVYPRGIRTVHEDDSRPPCDYLPPPTKPRAGAAVVAVSPALHGPRPAQPASAARPGHQLRRESRCA